VETCARLEANIAASEANVQIIRAAVSDAPGTGHLGGGEINRGEAKLSARSDTTELKALATFFEDASPKLHPSLLILETGREPNSPLIELCESNDYVVTKRTKLNTILKKGPTVKEKSHV